MPLEIIKILETITLAINDDYSFNDFEKFFKKETKVDKTILGTAYSWIYEKKLREIYQLKKMYPKPSKSLRIFSDDEVSTIGLQNSNYILHYYNIGMLTNSEFELILDQIKMFPEDARTTENINLLILSIFFDLDNVSVPGSRYMLYSSDIIN